MRLSSAMDPIFTKPHKLNAFAVSISHVAPVQCRRNVAAAALLIRTESLHFSSK